MRIVEIKYFNNYLYLYYINNKINFLTIIVDLNKMPFIIIDLNKMPFIIKER